MQGLERGSSRVKEIEVQSSLFCNSSLLANLKRETTSAVCFFYTLEQYHSPPFGKTENGLKNVLKQTFW